MASPNEIKFLSQKIKGCSTGNMGAPLLLPLLNNGKFGKHDSSNNSNNIQQRIINSSGRKNTASSNVATMTVLGDRETFSWGLRIDVSLIPRLPMYYLLEPKSTMTIQDIPVGVVETRLCDYFRLQSISYSFYEDSVRLECGTSGMLKFTVQFWQLSEKVQNRSGSGDDASMTLELQRRQGSVIEMQKIRREMFHFIMTGQKNEATVRQERQPPSVMMPDADMTYDPEESRKEALAICLRMLESPAIDQIKLGLESLMMMTNPSVVSRDDAVATSQDILFQITDLGRRIQNALSLCFGIASTSRPMLMDDDRMESSYGAYFEQLHNMGLKILGHALQLAAEEQTRGRVGASTLDLGSDFWILVAQDLFYNVERAVQRPHEACMAAKCVRLLSTLKGQDDDNRLSNENVRHTSHPTGSVSFHSCLAQAHEYGKRCHLSLEMESQKLLDMDVDQVLLSHCSVF